MSISAWILTELFCTCWICNALLFVPPFPVEGIQDNFPFSRLKVAFFMQTAGRSLYGGADQESLCSVIRVFLQKLSYSFSLRRCKKRLSHIMCQHSTLDHIGVPPLDLSPLAVAPQSLGRPLLVLMPLSFLPLPPTSLIIGIKQQLSVLMLSFKRTFCAQV